MLTQLLAYFIPMHCLRKAPTNNIASDVKLLTENSFAFDISMYILVCSSFLTAV